MHADRYGIVIECCWLGMCVSPQTALHSKTLFGAATNTNDSVRPSKYIKYVVCFTDECFVFMLIISPM